MKLTELLIKPVYAQPGDAAGGTVKVGVSTPEFAVADIGSLIEGLVNASIVIGALAAFMYLIMGGFQWITAGGDPKKTEEAQKKITNAVIGLIIIASAYAIINVVTTFLGLGGISGLTIPSIK